MWLVNSIDQLALIASICRKIMTQSYLLLLQPHFHHNSLPHLPLYPVFPVVVSISPCVLYFQSACLVYFSLLYFRLLWVHLRRVGWWIVLVLVVRQSGNVDRLIFSVRVLRYFFGVRGGMFPMVGFSLFVWASVPLFSLFSLDGVESVCGEGNGRRARVEGGGWRVGGEEITQKT